MESEADVEELDSMRRDEGQSRTGLPDIEEPPSDEDEEGEPTSADDRQVHSKMDSKPADDEVDSTNTSNGVILDEQVEMQSMSPVRQEGQPAVPAVTGDQREGSRSKSANDEFGQTPDAGTAVQPINLLGDFAAAASSESHESEDSKFVDTRATGSELESGVTTSNSVLEEMRKNQHDGESDDEILDFSADDQHTEKRKPPATAGSDDRKSLEDGNSTSGDSGATVTDEDESESGDSDSDGHHAKSKPLRVQRLSNHPHIKRMEHLSSRNLELHDQQRLRRWVSFFIQHQMSPSQLELLQKFFYEGHSLNDEIEMMQSDGEYMGDFAFMCTSLFFSHPCKVYEEDKNGKLVLLAHYKTEAAQEAPDADVSAAASHPTPFIFVKPYGVSHLMPALRPSAHKDELEHAELWYRDHDTNIDPVETKTCDPDDPTLLVYGMLGDGNCYWHSWAFLLEIHSHPWRPRDDALAHKSLGMHRRPKSVSVDWLNFFWRRQVPSSLAGSQGHAYGDTNISTIWRVLMVYHDVLGLHRLKVVFDYGCGRGQACFSMPMVARVILSLQGSAGQYGVEVTSISMEQDYSVFQAATHVFGELVRNALIGGREQVKDGHDPEPGCITRADIRLALAFQNSFDITVGELQKIDLVFGYDGSSVAIGSRSEEHATFIDKLLQAQVPFCMSSAGPLYVSDQPHFDAAKWMHFSIPGKQGKSACTMHMWIPKTMQQENKHRVGTTEEQEYRQQELLSRAQGDGAVSQLIAKAQKTPELPLEEVLDARNWEKMWEPHAPEVPEQELEPDDSEGDPLKLSQRTDQAEQGKMVPPKTRSQPSSTPSTFPRPGGRNKDKEEKKEKGSESMRVSKKQRNNPKIASGKPVAASGQTKLRSSSTKEIKKKRTTNSKTATPLEQSKQTKTELGKKLKKEKKTPISDSGADSEQSKHRQAKSVERTSGKRKRLPVAKATDSEQGSKRKQETPKSALKRAANNKETPDSDRNSIAASSSDSDSDAGSDGNHSMTRRSHSRSRSASRSRSRSESKGRKATSQSQSRSRSASRSRSRSKGKTVTFERVIDDSVSNKSGSRNLTTSKSKSDPKGLATSKSAKAKRTDSGPRPHGNSSLATTTDSGRSESRSNSKVKEKPSTTKSKIEKTETENLSSEKPPGPRGGKAKTSTIETTKSTVKKQKSARGLKSESEESEERPRASSVGALSISSKSEESEGAGGSSIEPAQISKTTSSRVSKKADVEIDRNVISGPTRTTTTTSTSVSTAILNAKNRHNPAHQLNVGISQFAEISSSIINSAVLPVLNVFHTQTSEVVKALSKQNRAGLHSISKTRGTSSPEHHRRRSHRGRSRRRHRHGSAGRSRNRDQYNSPSDSSSSDQSYSSYSDSDSSSGSSGSSSYSSNSRDRGSRRSKSRGRGGKDKHKRHKHRDGSVRSKSHGSAKRRRESHRRSSHKKSHKGSRK